MHEKWGYHVHGRGMELGKRFFLFDGVQPSGYGSMEKINAKEEKAHERHEMLQNTRRTERMHQKLVFPKQWINSWQKLAVRSEDIKRRCNG
jgi:hypothetical protein